MKKLFHNKDKKKMIKKNQIDLNKSTDFMTQKAIRRKIKQIKLGMIRKLLRDIKEAKEIKQKNSDSVEISKKTKRLNSYKTVDCELYSKAIFTGFKTGTDDHIIQEEEQEGKVMINPEIYHQLKSHRFIKSVLVEMSNRLRTKLEKSRTNRMSNSNNNSGSHSVDQSAKSMKALFRENAYDPQNSSKTSAIFIGSLNGNVEMDEDEQDDEDHEYSKVVDPIPIPSLSKKPPKKQNSVHNGKFTQNTENKLRRDQSTYYDSKKRKSRQNQQRMNSGDDGIKQDLSPYMPLHKRQKTKQIDNNNRFESEQFHLDLKNVPAISNTRKENDEQRSNFNSNINNSNNSINNKNNKRSSKSLDLNSNQPITTELVIDGKNWKSTGIHPSWAAKMVTKSTTMTTFTGKKIVFEDTD